MRMKTGPHLKGRQVEPPHGKRSLNQPENVMGLKMKGKAVAPTQGRTRNQPNTTSGSGKHAKIGVGVADTYHANSREAVPKAFTRHPHD